MKKALFLTTLGAALTFGTAQAGPVNIGGVIWDPNSNFDFSSVDSMIETVAAPVIGETIQGYARITTLNNKTQAEFCPGCEVTYVFYDYEITAIDPVTGAFTWTDGKIDVYVDNTPNWDGDLASTASDGVLFLALEGATHLDVATGNVGTLHSDPTPAAGTNVQGDGRGFLNVVGGLAAGNFDTDFYTIATDAAGTLGTADLSFTSSFQRIPGGSFTSDDGVEYGLFGGNDLRGNTVPAPATIALSGLALLGMGIIRRRRQT